MTDAPTAHQASNMQKSWVLPPPRNVGAGQAAERAVHNIFLILILATGSGIHRLAAGLVAVPPIEISRVIEEPPTARGTDDPLTITKDKAPEVDGFDCARAGNQQGRLGGLDVKACEVANGRRRRARRWWMRLLEEGAKVIAAEAARPRPISVAPLLPLSYLRARTRCRLSKVTMRRRVSDWLGSWRGRRLEPEPSGPP